jgi:hypothetical protein
MMHLLLEARKKMSIAKETAVAVPALAVLLFVSHSFLGPDESYREVTVGPRSWLGVTIPDARFLAKDLITGRASTVDVDAEVQSPAERRVSDLTPEARIKGVFAQFVPSVRRRAT